MTSFIKILFALTLLCVITKSQNLSIAIFNYAERNIDTTIIVNNFVTTIMVQVSGSQTQLNISENNTTCLANISNSAIVSSSSSSSIFSSSSQSSSSIGVYPFPPGPYYNISTLSGVGNTYYGVGSLSSGATSRFVSDYQSPYQSEILDYLFTPNFAAAHQIVKVEIGSDQNSAYGSESSHMHTSTDLNYHRGYEWWIMSQAYQRNPNAKFYGLAFWWPDWVAEGGTTPWTASGVTYLINWIAGAKSTYNLTIHYIGIWNENAYDASFIINLKTAILQNNFTTKIVAADQFGSWSICDDMASNAQLNASVDIIGTHYPQYSGGPISSCYTLNKPIWISEDWTQPYTNDAYWACAINRFPIAYGSSAIIAWNTIAGYYWSAPYVPSTGPTSLMLATSPWSGNYYVPLVMYVQSHTTHFSYLDGTWTYLPLNNGIGMLNSGGSYITLTNGHDVTIVVETSTSSTCVVSPNTEIPSQIATFYISREVTVLTTFNVYSTDLGGSVSNALTFQGTISLASQAYFNLTVLPNHIYTISTLSTTKQSYSSPPLASSFPVPYFDNFEGYVNFTYPRYLSQLRGSFELYNASISNTVVRQFSLESELDTPNLGPTFQPSTTYAVIGNYSWTTGNISATVLIENTGMAYVALEVILFGDVAIIFSVSTTTQQCNMFAYTDVETTNPTLSTGCPIFPNVWYNLTLVVTVTNSTAYLNDILIFQTTLLSAGTVNAPGFAAVGGSLSYYQIDNLGIGMTSSSSLPSSFNLLNSLFPLAYIPLNGSLTNVFSNQNLLIVGNTSGLGFTLDFSEGLVWSQQSLVDGCLQFPNIPYPKTFTFAAWIFINENSTYVNGGGNILLGTSSNSNSNGMVIYVYPNWLIGFLEDGVFNTIYYSPSSLSLNTWTHIGITLNPLGNVTIFVNGIQTVQSYNPNQEQWESVLTSNITVGCADYLNWPYEGNFTNYQVNFFGSFYGIFLTNFSTVANQISEIMSYTRSTYVYQGWRTATIGSTYLGNYTNSSNIVSVTGSGIGYQAPSYGYQLLFKQVALPATITVQVIGFNGSTPTADPAVGLGLTNTLINPLVTNQVGFMYLPYVSYLQVFDGYTVIGGNGGFPLYMQLYVNSTSIVASYSLGLPTNMTYFTSLPHTVTGPIYYLGMVVYSGIDGLYMTGNFTNISIE